MYYLSRLVHNVLKTVFTVCIEIRILSEKVTIGSSVYVVLDLFLQFFHSTETHA